jgi:S-DNA-T family DNA segregation ATPase FtsK/SpoIIIE
LAPLPALFVIVDEFSELLAQHPDFADMFVAIGRLGRSLGIHLLLASQRLDEGRLRGLESHLSYRVCLKTLSANESRIALGVPDAYELPNTPGLGYLRTAAGDLIRFQTAFVSGPCPDVVPEPAGDEEPATVRPFTAAPDGPIVRAEPVPGVSAAGRTVLATVLDQLSGHGPPAREVWLPPLGQAPTLDSLLGDSVADLIVPIGIIDRPFEQCRTPLWVDLRGAAGNVAVVGAPQSGKSTALATLITALAATQAPARVQVYCLDFGGGILASLASLPHVGSVAGRAEAELARRTVSEMESVVAHREALFRDRGIASMDQYRQLRATGDPVCAAETFGDVFLVVDGWAGLCREFDALEAPIVALAGRGLSLGVHVVLSASRWAEVRPGLRDQIGTRVELRLGDPADSELDRRAAQRVPRGKPGRGLTDGGLHTLIALPRLDGVDSPSGLGQAAVHTGELLRRRHGGSGTPPVPLLPALLHRRNLLEMTGPAGSYPLLGVDERGLEPVAIDFGRQPHLLILGDNECGKTSVLRTLCAEIVRTSTAEQAQLIVVDYRRSLLGVVDPDHLGGYAMSAAALSGLLPGLLELLSQRMPGPDVTAQQLRDRSWWSGPQLYLLVDDYDLVATVAGNPLTPLLEYLPHAGDVGLHLVIARRSGGAARAVYEPLLAALRDLGCMGLMMSANPDEGPLLGSARPARLPPGRGTLVTRAGGEQLIQVAWSPAS